MTLVRRLLALTLAAASVCGGEGLIPQPPYPVLTDEVGVVSLAFDGGFGRYPEGMLLSRLPRQAESQPLPAPGAGDAPPAPPPEETLRAYLDALRRDSMADIRELCADPTAVNVHDLPGLRGPSAPDDIALECRNLLGRYCVIYGRWMRSGKFAGFAIEHLAWNAERRRWLFTGELPINHTFHVLQGCSSWVVRSFPDAPSGDLAHLNRVPITLGLHPEMLLWEPPTPPKPDCHILARIAPGWPHPIEVDPGTAPAGKAMARLREAFAESDAETIQALWMAADEPLPDDFLGWSSDLRAKTRVVGIINLPVGQAYLLVSARDLAVPAANGAAGKATEASTRRHGALFWNGERFVSAIGPPDPSSDRYSAVNWLLSKSDLWQALAKSCASR